MKLTKEQCMAMCALTCVATGDTSNKIMNHPRGQEFFETVLKISKNQYNIEGIDETENEMIESAMEILFSIEF